MSACRSTGLFAIHRAPSKDPDQTAQKRSLIRVFAGRTLHKVHLRKLRHRHFVSVLNIMARVTGNVSFHLTELQLCLVPFNVQCIMESPTVHDTVGMQTLHEVSLMESKRTISLQRIVKANARLDTDAVKTRV